MSKGTRIVTTAMAIGVLAGALISGTSAQAAKRCGKFKAAEPISDSKNTAEATKAKVKKITDKYTQAKPFTVEYTHGPAVWFPADPEDAEGQAAAVEDTKWFNIQVDSKKKSVGLFVRIEWSPTPVSDIDLYMYDKHGGPAAQDGHWNQLPEGSPGVQGGNPGFEEIAGFGATDCSGYTIESRAFNSPGENMTLKIWLGSIR
ncbi:MAG: hypothetical protein M3285_07520 [Actinomycetota bacterium]|nr:hypothetical protein [Actinomycetota bacterium]